MNKKKSKVLAFLLATSLLVPSANGIVSAAEIQKGNEVAVESQVEKGAVYEVKNYEELKKTIEESSKGDTIKLISDITIDYWNEIENISGITIDGQENTITVNTKVGSSERGALLSSKGNNKFLNLNIDLSKPEETVVGMNVGIILGNNDEVDNVNVKGKKTKTWGFMVNNTCENVTIKNSSASDCVHGIYFATEGNRLGKDININENEFNNCEIALHPNNVDFSKNKLNDTTLNILTKTTEVKNNEFKGNSKVVFYGEGKFKQNTILNAKDSIKFDNHNIINKISLDGNYWGSKNPNFNEIIEGKETLTEGEKSKFKPYYIESCFNKEDAPMEGYLVTLNGKGYTTLEDAVRTSKKGDTIKLLSDIEADTWTQIGFKDINGITLKGVTIDGCGHTIKIKTLKSRKNHNAVFYSDGGNYFKNMILDLRETKPDLGSSVRGLVAGNGDRIEGLVIKGGEKTWYGITAGPRCEDLSIKNSIIENSKYGIYFEGKYENKTNTIIEGNVFDGCAYASILQPPGVTFRGNTVKGGKVNIMHSDAIVRENIFESKNGEKSRVKFYEDGIKFEYNKVMNDTNGKSGATIVFAIASETHADPVQPRSIVLNNNYWGSDKPNLEDIIKLDSNNLVGDGDKLDKLIEDVIRKVENNRFDTPKELEDALKPSGGGSVTPSIPSTPSKPSKPVYTHTEISGANRYETAAKVADELGSYDNVVLVNATSTMSDGLSASGLAGKENGAILLTKKDSIPKVTMDRIRKVKRVYIIGGEAAISQKVAAQITAAGVKVERIGGKDRVETSKLVAEKLGNYSDAFIVNGFKGEADAMSASSVAARYGAPILLTNGKTSTHAKKSGVEYYVVGGTSVVNKSIADKYNAERLAGKDRYATNREVIAEFYSGSDKLYLANGETLVDALTASTIAKNYGIVLVNKKSDNSVLKDKNTVQIGGMNFDIDFE